jgi:hypothetical protein
VGALDRVLLAAQEGSTATDEQVHELLMKECSWYQAVSGGEAAADPGAHCKPAHVSLTPETPEASTVPEPTVPPGGPGLFHIKGRELPPYVQHLWHHLAAKYGKHKAYGMAVGIVKKWAAGTAPGGKKGGKPRHTHPDVRAAAAKNVAQWEKDKADAHAQSAGHVKATAGQDAIALAVNVGKPFPGQPLIQLPPVPRAAKAMYTAHRIDDLITRLSHADERLTAAKQGKALRAYRMIHVNNNLSQALDTCHNLVASVKRNYLPEAREMEALNKTMGLAKSVTTDAKVATFAHLLQTTLYHLAHAKRHAALMLDPDPAAVWRFNWDHAAAHLKGAREHAHKLAKHVLDNYPEEARWLTQLGDEEYPYGDPVLPATGQQEAVALAQPAYTAPGAQPIPAQKPGLYQRPSQTVSPSPPLPPDVPLPTAAEIRKLIGQIPECSDPSLSASARNHLDAAAVKLSKDDPLAALHVLRAAQSDIYAAHKADLGALGPAQYTANVFARTVPPGERSSANTAMLRSKGQEMAWRVLEQAVAAAVDRIRRRHFHGQSPAGMQNARFSQEEQMTALEKVLRLAAGPPAAHDVSEPATSDTSMETKLLKAPDDLSAILGPHAARELAELSPIDRLLISAHMDGAKAALAGHNVYGATSLLARAKTAAWEAGAHHLAKHLHQHIESISVGESTHDPEHAAQMRAGDKVISPQDNLQSSPSNGNRT